MWKPESKEEIKKLVEGQVEKIIPTYLKNQAFTARKTTDTPNDGLLVVPRRYVNLYGTTAQRPNASVAHFAQQYFDVTINRPVYFNPNSSVWTDGAGSIS